MIKVHYRCVHVPQFCQCQYHKEVIFDKMEEKEFSTEREIVETFEKWNSMNCFLYVISKVENDYLSKYRELSNRGCSDYLIFRIVNGE